MNKLSRDQKHYSIRKIYEYNNKPFNFVISEHEAGKIKYKTKKEVSKHGN